MRREDVMYGEEVEQCEEPFEGWVGHQPDQDAERERDDAECERDAPFATGDLGYLES
jgi:hypothetical protein